MTAQHTPTPWSVCPKECSAIGVAGMDDGVFGKPRESIAIAGRSRGTAATYGEGWHYVAAINDHEMASADAAFIVRACNAHDDLVAALRDILDPRHTNVGVRNIARAALAKAGAK